MAISQSKYIKIVSGVAGSAIVGQRDLIGRVFTSNYLVPTNQVLEFSGGASAALATIATYFGSNSAEYAFAAQYFQPNKDGVAPQKISFAFYSSEATPAYLFGAKNSATLAQLQAITDGTLDIVVNGETQNFSSINLSSAQSFADVASTLSSTISSAGVSVEYDATNSVFVMQTTATGANEELGYATGTIATAIGWVQGQGITSDGTAATTAAETVSNITQLSNNYFTLYFLPQLSTADITAVAQWVSNQNVRYIYSITVPPTNASEIQEAVSTYNGVALTVDAFNANAGFMPMSRFASTDYSQANAAISMNYQQFTGVQPSVSTDAEAALYDAMKINYYGVTQQAGQPVAWYQPGVLQGTITDMGVYANEAWLKDAMFTSLLNLRLGLNTLPANNTGLSLVLSALSGVINQALYNGTVLPGKALTSDQKASITQITGDKEAWQTVQSNGYYLTADVQETTDNGVVQYSVDFLFVYSKGDSISTINGQNILI